MNFFSNAFIVSVGMFSMSSSCYSRENSNKPNIIFVLADDFSYRDLSVYGQTRFSTPNIDLLAQDGIRFTEAYSTAPECAPSRGALMTGMHCGRGTVKMNESVIGQNHLNDEDITVAEKLQKAGYKTAFVGKWGIGLPGSEGVPYKQGFDYSFGFYDQQRAHTFFPEYLYENDKKVYYPGNIGFSMARQYRTVKCHVDPADLNVYDDKGKLSPKEIAEPDKMVYSISELQQRALAFVEKHASEPFFLYYATPLPHGPIIVDDLGELKDRDDFPDQRTKEWAAMVKNIDEFVGKLTSQLKNLGVYDNTIIFFASDNGYSMHRYIRRDAKENWSDDDFLHNKGPFPGGKFSAREGGMRIPFFVHWHNTIKANVYSDPVWLADFFSTAVELSGLKSENKTDGVSLVPFIKGEPEQFKGREYMYWFRNQAQSIRMGAWHVYRSNPKSKSELYLIEEDTYCTRNLAEQYPEVVMQAEAYMTEAHVWDSLYLNPGDDVKAYKVRLKKARQTEAYIHSTQGNKSSKN